MGLIKLAAQNLDNEHFNLIQQEAAIRYKHDKNINTHYGMGSLIGAGAGIGLGALYKNDRVAGAAIGGIIGAGLGLSIANIHHESKINNNIMSSPDRNKYLKNLDRQESIENFMANKAYADESNRAMARNLYDWR